MPQFRLLSMRFSHVRFSVLSSLVVFGMVSCNIGCGGGGPAYPPPVAVSGKVSVKGQPLTGGTIHFVPVDGKKALPGVGQIQSDSSFKITTTKPDDGLVPGKYMVFFDPPVASDGSKNAATATIPEMYLSPASSLLTQTIEKPISTLQLILQ